MSTRRSPLAALLFDARIATELARGDYRLSRFSPGRTRNVALRPRLGGDVVAIFDEIGFLRLVARLQFEQARRVPAENVVLCLLR
jgi:hypothetical protein